MTAQASVDDNFTFVGGLNTEGGYFVTPKNSWVEGQNMVPQRDGSLERRPAFVLEEGYDAIYTAPTNELFGLEYNTDIWESVGGDGNRDWIAIQVGSTVTFREASPIATSARAIAGSINGEASTDLSFSLLPYRCFGNQGLVVDSPISIASVYGNLVITHKDCEPILVVWRENNALTVQKMKLQIRDFRGIPSPIPDHLEKNPSGWEALGFRDEALYNLYNQGWKNKEINLHVAANGTWPSNTKQWFQGKDVNDDFQMTVLNKIDFGTGRAPKGRFILEAFYEDRGGATAVESELDNIASTVMDEAEGSGEFKYPEEPL